MEQLHVVLLMALTIALAFALAGMRSLLAVAILTGAYSLMLAAIYTLLDAVDVAFTEAAVGAGIALTLMLAAISLTARREAAPAGGATRRVLALAVSVATGAALMYASLDLPALGDPSAPAHTHVADRYIAEGPIETGVPNIVTAVLASYRGYDTLGEVAVIFTAGVGAMALLRRREDDP